MVIAGPTLPAGLLEQLQLDPTTTRLYEVKPSTYVTTDLQAGGRAPRVGERFLIDASRPLTPDGMIATWCPARDCFILSLGEIQVGQALRTLENPHPILMQPGTWRQLRVLGPVAWWSSAAS